jgi:hypothetical protein
MKSVIKAASMLGMCVIQTSALAGTQQTVNWNQTNLPTATATLTYTTTHNTLPNTLTKKTTADLPLSRKTLTKQ